MKIYGLKQAFIVCGSLVALLCLLSVVVLKMLPKPEDVAFLDLAQAYVDAEQLMDRNKERTADPYDPDYFVASELPDSLQIDRANSAFVFSDHVSLSMYSNADLILGARIWRKGAVPPKSDRATAYDRITFFTVVKDLEKSGENRL